MSHIEQGGKVYCDWRLTIERCEASEFFRTVFLYSAVLSGVGTALMVCLIWFRVSFLGESWRGFSKGETRFHFLTIFLYLAHFVLILSVLLGAPFPATGVLWSFLKVFKFLVQGSFVVTTVQALPKGLIDESPKWFLRDALLYFFCILISSTHTVIISVAFSLIEEHPELGNRLEKAGLTITAINAVLLTIAELAGPCVLRRRLGALLNGATNMKMGEIDTALLTLTYRKLGQVILITLFNNALIIVNMLMLAYYPSYFTNLAVSKAFLLILYPINFTNALFYALTCLFFDFKKWIYREQQKEISRTSKREDSSGGHVRLSISGREQVEKLVDELKPKDP